MHTKDTSLPRKGDWRLWITLALLLAAITGSKVLSHGASVNLQRKLADFPRVLGTWQGGPDDKIDVRALEVLAATDTLSRSYVNPSTGNRVGLFVAFFSSQRKGGAIHSPKNCLPGSGWEPVKSAMIPITIPKLGKTVDVNEYVIQNGLHKQVVLYWYQSQGRTIASEYTAKMCLIWDAIRRNRTDGSLVRIITPVVDNEDRALETAKAFVQESFAELTASLPN